MAPTGEGQPDAQVETLQRTIDEYERWVRLLDAQMRVLDRERQKLSAVVTHADAGFLVLDASLKIVWANQFSARLSGAGSHPASMLDVECHQLLCRRAEACATCPAAASFRSRAVAHHEVCWDTDAGPRHLYATAMPMLAPTGEVDQAIVMIQDVSDLGVLRRSQEALRGSEERFRSIFERAAAGMATIGPDGSFLQVNDALCRFLGYPKDELLGLTVAAVVDGEGDENLHVPSLSHAGERQVTDAERRYVRKDGRPVWGRVTAAWLYDAAGEPTYAVTLIQDITEHKRAEEARRQSEVRKGAILDTALDAIVSIDHAGRITEFNTAAETMFGHRRADALGCELAELIVPPPLREAHRRGLARYLATGQGRVLAQRVELTALRADGSEIPVELAVTRIPLEGPPAFTAYIRDLTERKAAEQALRQSEEQLRQAHKMEAIGTLAGGVAHDFNNLLTGILGHAQLLQVGTCPAERVQRSAEVIETAARRGAALTQQLLGFARKGKHQNVPVHLGSTIDEVIGLLSRTLDKNIALRTRSSIEPAVVVGDPGQIQQVILNLAVNARDAMPEGGDLVFATDACVVGEHDARNAEGATAGGFVVLSIEDTGCGIPESAQARIFEPFFTTKERGKGTGMGLAMVYGIVKNHGGWVQVESEVGRGTTVRVYLPQAADVPESAFPRTEQGLAYGTGTILVVDDEEIVRSVAEGFLRHLGYDVVTAADGQEAVECYARLRDQIDAVLLDLVMPRMGGRDCFRALRELNPEVRAVLSTGYGPDVVPQELLDEGMRGLVLKPYRLEQLAEAMTRALRR